MLRFSSPRPGDVDRSIKELQEKYSLLQTQTATLTAFLQENDKHATDPLFKRKLLEQECLQQKCALYSILLTSGITHLDADTLVLIASYEDMLQRIYIDAEHAGYYVIELLKIDQEKSDDMKVRTRISIAIKICQKKVELMQLAAELMLEKLLQKLNIKPSDSQVLHNIKAKFMALKDYDFVSLNYSDGNFTLEFTVQANEHMLITDKTTLPNAVLLEQLLILHADHMPSVSADMLTDMYACAANQTRACSPHLAG